MAPDTYGNLRNQVPIGMLATELTLLEDGSAELLGYWYYLEKNLPETLAERKDIFAHWLNDRCCKIKLIGSAKQIEDILFASEWNPGPSDNLYRNIEDLVKQARKHRSIPFEVERLEEPKGTAIPVNVSVRLKKDLKSVIAELHSDKAGITLEIAPDWDLGEEITNFLMKTAN